MVHDVKHPLEGLQKSGDTCRSLSYVPNLDENNIHLLGKIDEFQAMVPPFFFADSIIEADCEPPRYGCGGKMILEA